jgi:hypothetical protein
MKINKVLPFIVGVLIAIIIFDAVNPWKVAFLFALIGVCQAFIIYDLINILEEKESNEIEDLNN